MPYQQSIVIRSITLVKHNLLSSRIHSGFEETVIRPPNVESDPGAHCIDATC